MGRGLGGIALLIVGCQAPGEREPQPEEVPRCATDLGAALDPLTVPGLSAGLVANGELACTAVAGEADAKRHVPVTQDTIFIWASVSKTLVATAIGILHDDGRLGLDDDIDQHLSFSTRNPNCPSTPITIRHLLTHTSSIVDNEPLYDDLYTVGDSPIALSDLAEGYVVPGGDYYHEGRNFLDACPGETNEYSNIAVGGVLAHVVEAVSGQDFEDFCRDRIFAPLGMDDASFRLDNLPSEQIARPHFGRKRGKFEPIEHVGFPTYPDGLLRTSVPSLAHFLAMMTNGGEYQGTRILAASTIEEMLRRQTPDLDGAQGLIWYYDFDDALVGHDGSDDGAASLMFYDPTTGAGALLVGNGEWYERSKATNEANALLRTLVDEAGTW